MRNFWIFEEEEFLEIPKGLFGNFKEDFFEISKRILSEFPRGIFIKFKEEIVGIRRGISGDSQRKKSCSLYVLSKGTMEEVREIGCSRQFFNRVQSPGNAEICLWCNGCRQLGIYRPSFFHSNLPSAFVFLPWKSDQETTLFIPLQIYQTFGGAYSALEKCLPSIVLGDMNNICTLHCL